MEQSKSVVCVVISSLVFLACNGRSPGDRGAMYSGEDVTGSVAIVRDKETNRVLLHVFEEGKWSLFSGSSARQIDFSAPVLEGEKAGRFPLENPDTVRSYFQFVTPRGRAVLAERHLPMAGGYNFRDLGGYKTVDGRYVQWGKVFRADDLYQLTTADLHYLAGIPLLTVVDFRAEEEIAQAQDRLPATVKNAYAYSISPGNMSAIPNIHTSSAQRLDEMMIEMYGLLVTDTLCLQQYRHFFALLQDESQLPLLFHCSAGKDRTGMAAALFLSALGVDEETIMEDYLLSNTRLGDKYAQYVTAYPGLKPLFQVKPEFLQAGWQRIKENHGTIERFLTNVLRVDIPLLRGRFLDRVESGEWKLRKG